MAVALVVAAFSGAALGLMWQSVDFGGGEQEEPPVQRGAAAGG